MVSVVKEMTGHYYQKMWDKFGLLTMCSVMNKAVHSHIDLSGPPKLRLLDASKRHDSTFLSLLKILSVLLGLPMSMFEGSIPIVS